ncbi:MAG: hypothetical protein SH818_17425, partial [Saprospiraceae bacterium]|nr:hypothetical protein [Saprospiraceae bacterium]
MTLLFPQISLIFAENHMFFSAASALLSAENHDFTFPTDLTDFHRKPHAFFCEILRCFLREISFLVK